MGKLAVTAQNQTSNIVYIDRDPNWDDQVLTINGAPQMEIYALNPGASAVVGVDWDATEMGVIFATTKNYDYDGTGFYQLTIGQDGDKLGITDGGPNGTPTFTYTLQDQQSLSMTMVFADASA
jgi:hypothetical protein